MSNAMNIDRVGAFTSSNIWTLMTNNKAKDNFGAPGVKYIRQKIYEIRLKRSLGKEQDARATAWGHLCEQYLFQQLSLEYRYESDVTYTHPIYDFWRGTPDFHTADTVGDGKCPWTLESFCDQVEAASEGVEAFKELKPEYYWQLVSNAEIMQKEFIELILFVPTLEQLMEIQLLATQQEENQQRFAFIHWAQPDELPYLVEGSMYKPLNIFRWKPLPGDREALTERVLKARKLLEEMV